VQAAHINLKVLLPYKIFAEERQILRIVATSPQGAFGILPHRLDCVASLSPGILIFETEGKEESYIAVDEGVLVKTGFDVLVSVRSAIGGMKLSQLREAVEEEFMHLNEQEQKVRSVLARMESGFIRRMAKFQQDRG
jgi:F-type H+-transporting ATPase subunit epsilon